MRIIRIPATASKSGQAAHFSGSTRAHLLPDGVLEQGVCRVISCSLGMHPGLLGVGSSRQFTSPVRTYPLAPEGACLRAFPRTFERVVTGNVGARTRSLTQCPLAHGRFGHVSKLHLEWAACYRCSDSCLHFVGSGFKTGEMTTPGVEPGLSRPQRDVLTTRRCGPCRPVPSAFYFVRVHDAESEGQYDALRNCEYYIAVILYYFR